MVDSIESSLGFPVQRFHELCSTRVTRVYELARGRVDSRGFAGRADVQGFSRWLAQGLFLGSRSFLDSVGGSSKVAYGRNLKRPLFGYASRRSLGVFLPSEYKIPFARLCESATQAKVTDRRKCEG